VEKVAVNRDTGRNPLFDVMFVFQNVERGGDEVNAGEMNPHYEQIPGEGLSALQSPRLTYEERTAKFDLTISAVSDTGGNRLLLGFQYCTRLFRGLQRVLRKTSKEKFQILKSYREKRSSKY
jgi:hypothetical protein